MSITDKELLTFCNLANLEMEYANLKIIEFSEDNDSDKTIKRNHTIYSLLQKEIGSFENKKLIKDRSKIREEIKNGKLGAFVDTIENEFIYSNIEELRKEAPIVMEYFDRYNVSNEKNKHEGAFLKEWEIICVYDQYEISKDELEALRLELENISRKEIQRREKFSKNVQIIIEKTNRTLTILSAIDLGVSNSNMLGVNGNPAINDDLGIGYDANSLISKGLNEVLKIVIDSSKYVAKVKIDFSDSKFKFIILRKGEEYVVVISNSAYDYSQEDYISYSTLRKHLTRAYFSIALKLKQIFSKFKVKEENIIITGQGTAAYLSQLVAIELKIKYVVFRYMLPEKVIKGFSFEDILFQKEKLSFLMIEDLTPYIVSGASIYPQQVVVKIKETLPNNELKSQNEIENLIAAGEEMMLKGSEIAAKIATGIIVVTGAIVVTSATVTLGGVVAIGGGIIAGFGANLLVAVLLPSMILFIAGGICIYRGYLAKKRNDKALEQRRKIINNLELAGILKDGYVKEIPKSVDLKKIYNIDKVVSLEMFLDILYYEAIGGEEPLELEGEDTIVIKTGFIDGTIKIKQLSNGHSINNEKIFQKDEILQTVAEELKYILNVNYSLNKNYNQKSYNVITGEEKEILSKANDIKMDNKYYYIENRSPENEYLFFPFLNKDKGMLENKLRVEYIKSLMRSAVSLSEEPKKYSEENIIKKSDEYWTILGKSYDEIKKKIVERLKQKENKIEYPYIDLVIKEVEKYIDLYLTKQQLHYLSSFIVVGICDKDGNYLNDEVGFIYEKSGKLKGRIVKFLLLEENEKKEEVSPLINSCRLKCNLGSKPSEFRVTTHNIYYINGEAIGTKKDVKAFENIQPFGECMHTGRKCDLNLKEEWEKENKELAIKGNETILISSILLCKNGGIIMADAEPKETKVMKFPKLSVDEVNEK